jgi:ABC-type phosphate transport system ATPase subunit
VVDSSGCCKSTLLRVLNRMHDLYPGQCATGKAMMDEINIIDPKVDLNALRARAGILLDEPAGALDSISTLKIDELKHDFAIAIVTHNMQEAASCADQVAFFYPGEMLKYAPAAQLFTSPKQRRTQEYVTGRFG